MCHKMPKDHNPYHQNGLSVNHDGERYLMPAHNVVNCTSDLWKWQTSGERHRWPAWIDNDPHPSPPERVDGHELSVSWIGHATVLIQTGVGEACCIKKSVAEAG